MPEQVGEVRAIRHQPARVDELSKTENRRNSRAQRQGNNFNPVGVHEWLAKDIQCVHPVLDGLERRRNILGAPDFQYGRLKTEPGDRRLYLAELLLISWIADIGHNRQATKTGDNLTQEIEALAGNFGGRLDRQAGNI